MEVRAGRSVLHTFTAERPVLSSLAAVTFARPSPTFGSCALLAAVPRRFSTLLALRGCPLPRFVVFEAAKDFEVLLSATDAAPFRRFAFQSGRQRNRVGRAVVVTARRPFPAPSYIDDALAAALDPGRSGPGPACVRGELVVENLN